MIKFTYIRNFIFLFVLLFSLKSYCLITHHLSFNEESRALTLMLQENDREVAQLIFAFPFEAENPITADNYQEFTSQKVLTNPNFFTTCASFYFENGAIDHLFDILYIVFYSPHSDEMQKALISMLHKVVQAFSTTQNDSERAFRNSAFQLLREIQTNPSYALRHADDLYSTKDFSNALRALGSVQVSCLCFKEIAQYYHIKSQSYYALENFQECLHAIRGLNRYKRHIPSEILWEATMLRLTLWNQTQDSFETCLNQLLEIRASPAQLVKLGIFLFNRDRFYLSAKYLGIALYNLDEANATGVQVNLLCAAYILFIRACYHALRLEVLDLTTEQYDTLIQRTQQSLSYADTFPLSEAQKKQIHYQEQRLIKFLADS